MSNNILQIIPSEIKHYPFDACYCFSGVDLNPLIENTKQKLFYPNYYYLFINRIPNYYLFYKWNSDTPYFTDGNIGFFSQNSIYMYMS